MEYHQVPFPTWVITPHVRHDSLNDKHPQLVILEFMDLSIDNPREVTTFFSSSLLDLEQVELGNINLGMIQGESPRPSL